jgi:predicted TIM-barrel fold metal-dependent hydrolase
VSAASLRGRRIVDVHAHYLPEALVEAFGRRTEIPRLVLHGGEQLVDMGAGLAYPLFAPMVDTERQLELMDAHGIAISVLSVTPPGVDDLALSEAAAVARAANDELADVCGRSAGRLVGLAVLPTLSPATAAKELERAVALGLRGAVLYSNAGGRRPDEKAFRPIFTAAAELDVPLVLHPTMPVGPETLAGYALTTTIGFLVETTLCALRLVLDGLYARHPAFVLVVPHVGAVIPYILGRIDYEAALIPGGAGKLDGPPSEHLRCLHLDSVCAWPPALRLALEVFGPERILFGSDVPFWRIEDGLRALDELDLDEGEAELVCHANAERLFRLVPAAPAAGA